MIAINELLSNDRVLAKIEVQSKKKALQSMAKLLAAALVDNEEVSEMDLLDALTARERLGTTGLGHGVSLPHGRIEGLVEPIGSLVTLREGVDYDSPDGEPVDIMFALVVPESFDDEHLNILASLAGLFSDEPMRETLRSLETSAELYDTLKSYSDSQITDSLLESTPQSDDAQAGKR